MHDPYRGEVPDSNSSDGKDHYYRTEKRKIEDKETGEEKIIKVKYCARSSCRVGIIMKEDVKKPHEEAKEKLNKLDCPADKSELKNLGLPHRKP